MPNFGKTLASFVIKIKADETFDYQGLKKVINKAVSRVFSGLSAVFDFEIINFREYDCSLDTGPSMRFDKKHSKDATST